MPRRCKHGGITQPNGNCSVPGDDDLPVQCIGEWSLEKHDYISRYVNASSGPRGRFLAPHGTGGAAYIDLFAGPGRSRVQKTGQIVDGSPLIALGHQKSPFTRVILCDRDPDNAAILRQRVAAYGSRASVIEGDSNEVIDQITAQVPSYGLNIALIDPFVKIEPLRFETIRKLAAFRYMDIILLFPTMDLKRNLDSHYDTYSEYITRFLGTDSWKDRVHRAADVHLLIDEFRAQLAQFGYTQDHVRTKAVKTVKNNPIYHLVYVSKHAKGDAIWGSIVRISADGQKSLFD